MSLVREGVAEGQPRSFHFEKEVAGGVCIFLAVPPNGPSRTLTEVQHSLTLDYPILLQTPWFLAAVGTSWVQPFAKSSSESSQSWLCSGSQSVSGAGK